MTESPFFIVLFMSILFSLCIAFNFVLVACKTYNESLSLALANGIAGVLIPLAAFVALSIVFKNQGTACVGGIITCVATFIAAIVLL